VTNPRLKYLDFKWFNNYGCKNNIAEPEGPVPRVCTTCFFGTAPSGGAMFCKNILLTIINMLFWQSNKPSLNSGYVQILSFGIAPSGGPCFVKTSCDNYQYAVLAKQQAEPKGPVPRVVQILLFGTAQFRK
jgi:hypothetical protein